MPSVTLLDPGSASKIFASRPSFAGEWASELLTSITRSSCDNRQFMGGSLLNPVSAAAMCRVCVPKHSSSESNPELDPNRLNQGVQACAGITMQSGEVSMMYSTILSDGTVSVGRPSAINDPNRPRTALIRSATSNDGQRMMLWIFRSRPPDG